MGPSAAGAVGAGLVTAPRGSEASGSLEVESDMILKNARATEPLDNVNTQAEKRHLLDDVQQYL